MSFATAQPIADTVLYEGYLLYPYRHSALKNHFRWLFGVLRPERKDRPLAKESGLGCECLLLGDGRTELVARLRFLQPPPIDAVDDEPQLHEVDVGPRSIEALTSGKLRRQFAARAFGTSINGELQLEAVLVAPEAYRLKVSVFNRSPSDPLEPTGNHLPAASMVSTQVLLAMHGGRFIELRDPPESLKEAALSCQSSGLWPILLGDRASRDTLLCPPIILDDYPQLAPESPGDFFDSTEIDELLSLRILTLTEDEKQEMRHAGVRMADLLRRTEALGLSHLSVLHGAIRSGATRTDVRVGDRVRLRPRRRADIFDLALEGQAATVTAVKQDYDGRTHVVVTVDEDPGSDLGLLGQPGHQFFFAPDEIELTTRAAAR